MFVRGDDETGGAALDIAQRADVLFVRGASFVVARVILFLAPVMSPSLSFLRHTPSINVSTNLRVTVCLLTSPDGFSGWMKVIKRDGWKCVLPDMTVSFLLNALTLDFLLAFGDFQGNFIAVKVRGTDLQVDVF